MAIQPLIRPQLPPPKPTPHPKDWKGIGAALEKSDKYLLSLVLYLQNYLTRTYNVLVPTQYPVASVSNAESPYSPTGTDCFLAVSASASSATNIQLPVATGSGRTLIVQKVDANAQNVVIIAAGADKINGIGMQTLTTQYQTLTVIDYATGQWGAY